MRAMLASHALLQARIVEAELQTLAREATTLPCGALATVRFEALVKIRWSCPLRGSGYKGSARAMRSCSRWSGHTLRCCEKDCQGGRGLLESCLSDCASCHVLCWSLSHAPLMDSGGGSTWHGAATGGIHGTSIRGAPPKTGPHFKCRNLAVPLACICLSASDDMTVLLCVCTFVGWRRCSPCCLGPSETFGRPPRLLPPRSSWARPASRACAPSLGTARWVSQGAFSTSRGSCNGTASRS